MPWHMDRSCTLQALAQIEQSIAAGDQCIGRVQDAIARLKQLGLDDAGSRTTLASLQYTQCLQMVRRKGLLRELYACSDAAHSASGLHGRGLGS